jgi:hypothetical protein
MIRITCLGTDNARRSLIHAWVNNAHAQSSQQQSHNNNKKQQQQHGDTKRQIFYTYFQNSGVQFEDVPQNQLLTFWEDYSREIIDESTPLLPGQLNHPTTSFVIVIDDDTEDTNKWFRYREVIDRIKLRGDFPLYVIITSFSAKLPKTASLEFAAQLFNNNYQKFLIFVFCGSLSRGKFENIPIMSFNRTSSRSVFGNSNNNLTSTLPIILSSLELFTDIFLTTRNYLKKIIEEAREKNASIQSTTATTNTNPQLNFGKISSSWTCREKFCYIMCCCRKPIKNNDDNEDDIT